MTETPFKTRVKEAAIENAKLFKENFVDYEYCIFSDVLDESCYITKAFEGNYLHLVGVNTSLPAASFFKKCLDGTLLESDISFDKKGVGTNDLKGAVRDKIKVLPNMMSMFSDQALSVQANFKKNRIECAIASSDGTCTLGFSESGHPKSLLKGDKLDISKKSDVALVLRRKTGTPVFTEVMYRNEALNIEIGDIPISDSVKEQIK